MGAAGTTTTAGGVAPDPVNHATPPSNQSVVPPNQSCIAPDIPDPTSHQPDPSPATPNQSRVVPDILDPTSHQPNPSPATPNPTNDQLSATDNHADRAISVQPENNTEAPSEPDPVLPPPPGNGTSSAVGATRPSNLLAGIKDEPAWMQKKETLRYFRGTFKLGSLPDVIEHWYELERALGFKKVVSILGPFSKLSAHDDIDP